MTLCELGGYRRPTKVQFPSGKTGSFSTLAEASLYLRSHLCQFFTLCLNLSLSSSRSFSCWFVFTYSHAPFSLGLQPAPRFSGSVVNRKPPTQPSKMNVSVCTPSAHAWCGWILTLTAQQGPGWGPEHRLGTTLVLPRGLGVLT